ncbi:signal recognition particle-docking protein FtsY [Thermosynechococcus vestitus]|uniref:Signal recognition particle receptor FtsY n=1 Tax=Thermosynechococcus vestitus (strain NIES-2133 / IAM M-273 / BP-1) TaxID=197221 RepID=Q8DKD1_THEVB|nr:signal recognition particle-docking protein FtsY [Thermosynechococcus vestitus]BAC08480.1 cell division protein [Thermosynechococcus vestitus BP-1]
MVFNWFRRKFGGSGEEPSPAAESPTEVPPAESTASTASPGILNWAKTALQSIQARQQSQRPTTVETTEETQETPTAEPVAADASFPVSTESTETAVAEPAPIQPLVEAEPREPDPPLLLDEGFLWSAAVLAAQGRRPEEVDLEEITWLQRLRQGLGKTRRGLVHQLRAIVGQGPLSRDAVEAIEMLLLQADVGVKATEQIIAALQTKIRQETLPADQAIAYLKEILRDILDRPFQQGYRRNCAPKKGTLNIWLIAGVNGVGKTTTIGKLAHIATQSGYRCLIAAADTFRAAATEQVKIWGQRSNVEVIANPGKNTDPAAVVFDAIGAAQARGTELLLVDTAGRLQNKANLMEELKKIRRIIDKRAGDAQIESLLVLDATLGQNGLRQAQVFAEAAQLTGVILTKLDGTAKGGVALAVVQELGLPIRFIGAGEGIKDLRPFSSFEFVEALLSSDAEVAA